MNKIEEIEKNYLKKKIPEFKIGDTVKVSVKIKEGKKERTQIYEGVVISRRGSGLRETFTVRKRSYDVGVERIFPIHSKFVENIEVVRKGAVKRAKLYYLRKLAGKKARVKERR